MGNPTPVSDFVETADAAGFSVNQQAPPARSEEK
jgi:hypothetical protein